MKTVVIGEPQDSIAILLIVARNAVSAHGRNIAPSCRSGAIRMAPPKARTLRDAESLRVPAHEQLPGDIVVLEACNVMPADLRLPEAVELQIDESAPSGSI